jgi:type II secretory pathway component PulF
MPRFTYKARDHAGKAIAGTLEAANLEIAGAHLLQQGYLPVAISETGEADSLSLDLSDLLKRFHKVGLEDLIFFSQQLSTLYKAGLPLLTGLDSLREQAENQRLKEILEVICRQIREGATLFESLSRYPDAFPPIYVNMVRAGETSGLLGECIDRFVTLANRELRTRQRVKEATRYPKIVILSVLVAFAVLLIFVIPRFVEVFRQFNTPLPLPTRIMIGANAIFHGYWYVVICVLIGIPIFMRRYLRTPKGKQSWDRIKNGIPVFGPLFIKVALSRFAYTFVMLNRSGIPILQTLEITSSTIDNTPISQSVDEIGRKIRDGKSMTEAMKESGNFTPMVIQMVSVGESSGTLDEMLSRVTEYYDIEVDNSIKKMATYIEPTLTLFLGMVVLFLALAVFLPWWNMASLFK